MAEKDNVILAYLGDRTAYDDYDSSSGMLQGFYQRHLTHGIIFVFASSLPSIKMEWERESTIPDHHNDRMIKEVIDDVGGCMNDYGDWEKSFDVRDPNSVADFRNTWDKAVDIIDNYLDA